MQTVKVVTVKHRSLPGLNYRCMAVATTSGVLVWKCGKCGRGNLWGKLRERCKVCRAVVNQVEQPAYPQRNPVFGVSFF